MSLWRSHEGQSLENREYLGGDYNTSMKLQIRLIALELRKKKHRQIRYRMWMTRIGED